MNELLLIALTYLFPCHDVIQTLEHERAMKVSDVYGELAPAIIEQCSLNDEK